MKQLIIGALVSMFLACSLPQTGFCSTNCESKPVCMVGAGDDPLEFSPVKLKIDQHFILPDEILISAPKLEHFAKNEPLQKSAAKATDPCIRGPTLLGITSFT